MTKMPFPLYGCYGFLKENYNVSWPNYDILEKGYFYLFIKM